MKVFISYARKDGGELASRLEVDLRAAGHAPWLDRSQLEGGASWTDDIEVAIDGCAVALAVLTPASYASPICRAEQLRALRKEKRVIPLLARPDADRPLHLEGCDYRDFTGSYERALDALLRDLPGSERIPLKEVFRRTYVNAPPRPPHFVERPEEVDRVRHVLLCEEAGQTVGVTAIRGLGGIGKTVLANLLARDPVVQDAFPDGVLWLEIGRTPARNLASQLTELGREVEGARFRPENYATEEAATSRLRRILPDKAALIVLDDVWDPAQARPFLFEAPRCRWLVTSREARVVRALGASEVPLGSMTPSQSVELLQGWAGRSDPSLGEIAASLGHLPVALRIAGARLRKLTAREWLDDFGRQVSRIRLTLAATGRDESVEACFLSSVDGLAERHRPLFDALGIFPKDLPVPVAQAARLWRSLDPALTDRDCRDVADELDGAALVQLTPEKTLVLHDLVHEFARERLGDQVPRLNQLFLAAHNPARSPWYEAADDGYLYRRLAWHLAEAGRTEELERLLGSYRWTEAKLERTAVAELLSDFELLEAQHELRLVQGALRLSAHVLSVRPEELPSQLLGRLHDCVARRVHELCEQAAAVRRTCWLRPLRASLARPGGPLIRTLAGHVDWVRAVTVTPDGRRAVSGSDDRTIKVWDLESGAQLYELAGHANGVTAVAVTPDGKRAVSSSGDSTRVWDLESGTEERELAGHGDFVEALAVTPDGRWVVSASSDRTLRIWDLESGTEERELAGHADLVAAVAVTSDGRRAVSGSHDQTVRVWALETGAELRELAGHTDRVTAVAVTPDGRRAVSGSHDKTLRVWDLESGTELRVLAGHTDWVEAVAVTPDGKRAVSGSYDKTLRVWDLESGAELQELPGHAGWVMSVAVTPDGKRAVSASWDETLKVWDLEGGTERRELARHADRVTAVAVTPQGRRALSASLDETLRVWDPESGAELCVMADPHGRGVTAVAVTPDGRRAISASYDKTVKVWDLESGAQLRELAGHADYVESVAVTPEGKRAVSASADKTLRVWDLETGAELRELAGHTAEVTAVALTPDGKRAVSASGDQTLKVWDLDRGAELRELRGHAEFVQRVAITPDGRRAVSAANQTLKVWDLESGAELRELAGHAGWVEAVALTPDGKHAVSASWDRTLRVWDLGGEADPRELAGHADRVMAVAVTPNGKRIVSASDDRTIRVWDLDTGEPLCSFTADAPATCLASTAQRVLAGDSTGGIHLLAFEQTADERSTPPRLESPPARSSSSRTG